MDLSDALIVVLDKCNGKLQMPIEEQLQPFMLMQTIFFQVEKKELSEFGLEPIENY